MTHEQIVRKMKSLRTTELDELRSDLELMLRDNKADAVKLNDARRELNIVHCELDERHLKGFMSSMFTFRFDG
jgi:hypothetical protein